MLSCLAAFMVGCGGEGGTTGDANDQAQNGEDDASMMDETGTFDSGKPKKQGDAAGGV